MGGSIALIFRKEIYEEIFKGVRNRFGTAGEAFLYYVGFETGKQAYLNYVQLAGTEEPKALITTAKAVNMTLWLEHPQRCKDKRGIKNSDCYPIRKF